MPPFANTASMSLSSIDASACADALIQAPVLPGGKILTLSAAPVFNYSSTATSKFNYNHPTIEAKGVDFCNVTVTYTHPGQGDELGIETWLPLNNWNGRIQSVGGGGWVAGRFFLSYQAMTGAIAEGYVTSSVDAGLHDDTGAPRLEPDDWALVSDGNVDLYNLKNFGSVSLHDQAVVVKALTESFYGRKHDYAYWSGCSQGGRQGLALAQNYPDDYDGIAASAPALYIPQFFTADLWPHVVMNHLDEFPRGCEFDYITAAAVAECDPLDGRVDGIISDESLCDFDPSTLVGQSFNCSDTGRTTVLSEAAATIAASAWAGPRTPSGDFLWFGPNVDARLSGSGDFNAGTSGLGIAQTVCESNGTCEASPVGFGDKWLGLFAQKNASANWEDWSVETYASLFKRGVREFDSFVGTSDADLSEFRAAGGKLITYHGMADHLIPLKQMEHYYDQVLEKDPNAQDFYRLFEVPGLAHCSGGSGGQPTATWDALLAWVENGTAPDTLPIHVQNDFVDEDRVLVPYPKKPNGVDCGGSNSTSA